MEINSIQYKGYTRYGGFTQEKEEHLARILSVETPFERLYKESIESLSEDSE